jgi:RimJ/RimL family protein N-acetyltransferase
LDHVRFNHPADGYAIAARAGTYYDPASGACICRLKDDVRIGGVIYSNFTGESIAMHTASWDEHWVNRDLIYLAFDYPFNQLKVKRIFGLVPEDNVRARKFNENVGCRTVARIEGVFPGDVACLVMRLDREDCRLLRVRPRRYISNAA